MQTVVETPTYLAVANKFFSEEERADIVALVAAVRNVETSFVERADFEKSGLHAREWKKWRGAGCLYPAQREISGFSDYSFSKE